MIATPAFAAKSGTAGTATAKDVTLASEAADFFKYAGGVNPHGNDGAIGFSGAFQNYGTGAWSHIADFETRATKSGTDEAIILGSKLDFTFKNVDGFQGGWTIKNTDKMHDLTLDLVFAMHTGGGSGAWLFNDQKILAGETLTGTWVQKMYNPGGSVGAFSNLTLFSRNELSKKVPDEITEVPEPATLASLGLGLGLLGLARRRKQK